LPFGVLLAIVLLSTVAFSPIYCEWLCPFKMVTEFQAPTTLLAQVQVKCAQSRQCVRTCPTFSLDESSLASGNPLMTCAKCAQCVDVCPREAISYHVKGTPLKASPAAAPVLFLYPAYLLLLFLGGGIVAAGLLRILRLVATGSMLSS
jgi:ferredoxin-type protein NapH